MIPPGRKLEDLIRLSELCVDLLRGNEEFYAEVSECGLELISRASFSRLSQVLPTTPLGNELYCVSKIFKVCGQDV